MNANNFQLRWCADDGPDHIVSFPYDQEGYLAAMAASDRQRVFVGLYENVGRTIMHIVDFGAEGKAV